MQKKGPLDIFHFLPLGPMTQPVIFLNHLCSCALWAAGTRGGQPVGRCEFNIRFEAPTRRSCRSSPRLRSCLSSSIPYHVSCMLGISLIKSRLLWLNQATRSYFSLLPHYPLCLSLIARVADSRRLKLRSCFLVLAKQKLRLLAALCDPALAFLVGKWPAVEGRQCCWNDEDCPFSSHSGPAQLLSLQSVRISDDSQPRADGRKPWHFLTSLLDHSAASILINLILLKNSLLL